MMNSSSSSSCINDFIMFGGEQHNDDENNMSSGHHHRGPWKRERSSSNHHLKYLSPNEDEELANCLVLLSNSGDVHDHSNNNNNNKHGHHGKGKTVKKQKTAGAAAAQVFQCKACKKVFASHQALGGHRASHKKVKGCFASQDKEAEEEEEEEDEYKEEDEEEEEEEEDEDEEEDRSTSSQIPKKRSNAHECTICHRVFSSGQALGGHKRCHWLTPSNNYLRMPLHNHHHHQVPSLDLNLACQEYSVVDPTVMMSVGRDGSGGNNNNNINNAATSSNSWLKLSSGDWS